MRDTDAFSNSLKEQVYAGSRVIIGSWLKYYAVSYTHLDVYKRQVEDQSELAAFYSLADVTLLTSEKETFSMVCAESLCCGTPVVGFQAGAPEGISLPAVSYTHLDVYKRQVYGRTAKNV